MIDALYAMLIGSLLIIAIAVAWVIIITIVVSTTRVLRKRR